MSALNLHTGDPLSVQEYTLRPHRLSEKSIEPLKLQEQLVVLKRLSDQVTQLLNVQGLEGRYLVDIEGLTLNGKAVPQLKLFVNFEGVLRTLRLANRGREIEPHVLESINQPGMESADKAERLCQNQIWEAARHALSIIECQLPNVNNACGKYPATSPGGTASDARLYPSQDSHQARVNAVKSIQTYLADNGLSRSFRISTSQWSGTHNSLRMIGTAEVRATLEISPLVDFRGAPQESFMR